MKIYFDELGNTGCLTREGHETYCGKDGQSLYALGAVLSPESEDGALAASYEAFKERCGAAGREVKGSDLLTRKCNDQLSDFFETFLVCGVMPVFERLLSCYGSHADDPWPGCKGYVPSGILFRGVEPGFVRIRVP